jgi:hypothetical protein
MVAIVNVEKYPGTVKVLTDTVVLSVSNTVKNWNNFDSFANVSMCLGFSGFNANNSDGLNVFWAKLNDTAIQVSLSVLTYGRYSYFIVWN